MTRALGMVRHTRAIMKGAENGASHWSYQNMRFLTGAS